MIAVIGVPLDIAIGERLSIKTQALLSGYPRNRKGIYTILKNLLKDNPFILFAGEIEVPPLFRPFPPQEFLFMLSEGNSISFLENDGLREIAERVERKINSMGNDRIPLTVACEHGVIYGAVKALKKRTTSMTFICFDAHFDIIPLHLRSGWKEREPLSSANFILFLLEEKVLSPDEIIICGVSERFRKSSPPYNFINSLRRKGIKVISRDKIEKVCDLETKNSVYISIDADVCTSERTFAVRNHNLAGVDPSKFEKVFTQFLKQLVMNNKKICGLDICEIDPLIIDENSATIEFWSNIIKILSEVI